MSRVPNNQRAKVLFNVRVAASDLQALHRLARLEGRSLSSLARETLRPLLDRARQLTPAPRHPPLTPAPKPPAPS